VERLPPEQQAGFTDLLRAKGRNVDAGVVEANHRERKRYWKHWQEFTNPFTGVDEMLTGVPDPERIELLTAFAERVRRGYYGNGTRVRAGTVQVALRAIGKTFEMDGLPNPTYRSEGKYWLQLERLIEAYRRQDPPAQHKLAVPVSLVTYLYHLGTHSTSDKVQAICDMLSIAFYYLLRVGSTQATARKAVDAHSNSEPATSPSTTPAITSYPTQHLWKRYTLPKKPSCESPIRKTEREVVALAMTPPAPRPAPCGPSPAGFTTS